MTRAFFPALVAVAMLAPARARAQLETPRMPVPLPVETAALLWVRYEETDSRVRYARAGTTPVQYRLGSESNLENAPWQSFREGATGSFVSSGLRWITGTLPAPNNYHIVLTGCPANFFRYRVYFQFRIRNAAMQLINSPVRSDSTACRYAGG